MPTRVKVCGITSLRDALAAIDAGADALGFVFYPPSPRYIDEAQAADIIAQLPAFVTSVALFVDADADSIRRCIALTKVDLLQFHGSEDETFCRQFDRPYIKALRVNGDVQEQADVLANANAFASAKGILLDTYRKGVPGGTGERFDWRLVPETLNNVILAGGLTSDNVGEAITMVAPYAVDVSGGVEASHGVKDVDKIKQFFAAIQRSENDKKRRIA